MYTKTTGKLEPLLLLDLVTRVLKKGVSPSSWGKINSYDDTYSILNYLHLLLFGNESIVNNAEEMHFLANK